MTQKDKIQQLLIDRSPLSPKEIALETGIHPNVVRTLIRQMLNEGRVDQPSYGMYRSRQELPHITNKSKVHDILKQSPVVINHYEAFLRSVPYQMAMFDTEARFIMATESYIDAFQIREHVPLEGKRMGEVFTNEDSLEYERDLLGGNPSTRLTTRYYEPNGIGMYLAWRTKPWYINGSKTIGGYIAICSSGPDKDKVEAVADIAYDESGMPWAALSVGNDTIDVVKYAGEAKGELTTTGEPEDKLSLNRANLIRAIDAIIKSQIPEEDLDMLLEANGGTLRLRVTEMYRKLGGHLRKIEILADISNYTPRIQESADPEESLKKEPPTDASWKTGDD